MLHARVSFAQKLPFSNYTTANGLTHNRTHIARQDGMGYIWIGTDMGICRFDGRTFKHFPCPVQPYFSTRGAATSNGQVMFCVDYYGVAICCGDSVQFVKFDVPGLKAINGIVAMKDSSCYVINLPNELYHLKNGIAQKVPLSERITKTGFTDIFKDSRDQLWLMTSLGLALFPVEDRSVQVMIPFFDKEYINSVREDRNNDIYVATHSGIICRYRKEQRDHLLTALPETIMHSGPGWEVTSMAFDNAQYMWMTTTMKGLVRYNKVTRKVDTIGVANGLSSQNTWETFYDKEDNLWVTSENGLNKLATRNYSSYDVRSADYQNVKCTIVWNDSTVLFSNMVGIYAYVNGQVTKLSGYKSVHGYLEHMMMRTPDNKLLVTDNISTAEGRFANNTYRYEISKNDLIHKQSVKDLPGGVPLLFLDQGCVISGDELWVNAYKGLNVYKNGRMQGKPVMTDAGKILAITYMAQNKQGDLWFIDAYRNLVRYSKEPLLNDTFPYKLKQQQYLKSSQLGDQGYYKMRIDSRGYIWLTGKEKGLCQLITDAKGNVVKVRLFPAGTFSSTVVNDIIEDDEHNMWVATALGLDKMTFSGDSFTVEKDVYGTELCGKYIFSLSIIGKKLFAGTTGCIGIMDIGGKETGTVPLIHISGIRVNEHNMRSLIGTDPVFSPEENIISFTFTGISFKDEHSIRYSYMLDGIDQQWSQPQSDYNVTYSKLPPGTYTFLVKARSGIGLWSAPATFTFTISQPYYTRWWFIALVVLVIGGIIYAIYRYRINRILEIQHIRQTISKDLHDDIGATVSSINILANMAKSDLVSEAKRNQFLETIQDESKHVSESLNDIVWSINPKNDTPEIMYARMQRYASELFEAGNIAYEFVLPGEGELTIDMKRRQHLYLIYKEAINNLVKYSKATSAWVTIVLTKSDFSINISDNGKGFDAHAEHTGNGIYNMRKRAEEIGAELEIKSEPGKGTSISLRLAI